MGVNQFEPLLMICCIHENVHMYINRYIFIFFLNLYLVTSATFLIMLRISIVDGSNVHNYPDKG